MADWIILDKTTGIGSDEVTITVSSYTELTERLKNLVFTTTDNKASDTCVVRQYGEEGYLKVTPSSINMVYGGGYVDVTVSSTEEWAIGTLPAWISSNTSRGSKGDTIIRLTISSNSSTSERSYNISFVSENYNASLSVSQAKYVEGEIVPPTINPDDCEGGTFTVRITGDGCWSFEKDVPIPSPICDDAVIWGTYDFNTIDKITPILEMDHIEHTPTVDGYKWAVCDYEGSSIEYLSLGSKGDNYKQYKTIAFNKKPFSQVWLMTLRIGSYLFGGCKKLEYVDTTNFSTKAMTVMDYMFNGCTSLTRLDISNFKTSYVKTMRGMFHGCRSLTSLDFSSFNTSKVTDMQLMFYDCRSLTSLDLSSFDTSNMTSMFNMFAGCTNLEYVNMSNFDLTKVQLISFFNGCSSLERVNVSNCGSSTQNMILKSLQTDLSSYTWKLSDGIIRRS